MFNPVSAYQNIAVIGTGYVGLVTGAGLAEYGNTVICADIDDAKIQNLQIGIIPIYEPGLQELVIKNMEHRRLSFTSNVADAIQTNDVIFIAVGTPMGDDGNADMRAVNSVLQTIAQCIHSPKPENQHILNKRKKIIVIKSTVPVGTGQWARKQLEAMGISPDLFYMVSNPEFLKEGSAVHDFLYPDRIVIGTNHYYPYITMLDIYKAASEKNIFILETSIETAETIKYASNAFLAVKLSYINELANLCDKTGADIAIVAWGMGLDQRISQQFLQPGPGFGGSCFPKDSLALLRIAQKLGTDLHVVEASLIANEKQKRKPVEKLLHLMDNNIAGKTIAVLGLAFKANTDDIRYSPASTTVQMLLENGAFVQAYDPAAIQNMKKLFPNITYSSSAYEALNKADAAIIVTEWAEFSQLDLERVKNLLKTPIIVDTRNMLDPYALKQAGFAFSTMGRGHKNSL
ncbi:UDP-glucose/GDP-mannose dehydrogenase family protein [Candidatus Dependentiae bacterium]|nr:UDP-glucose/GDP-mannose dehydrogenase family protein [Candidatus Dependentiae bacterium]